jgi:hypothetical protein
MASCTYDTQREEDQERGKLGDVIAGDGREGSEPTRTTAKISLVDPECFFSDPDLQHWKIKHGPLTFYSE